MTSPAPIADAVIAAGAARAARPALSVIQGGAAGAVLTLAERQAAARDRIASGTLTLVSRQWDTVVDPRDPDVIEAVSHTVLRVIQGGQAATANTTAGYLAGVLTQLSSRHVAIAAGSIVLAASLRGLATSQAAEPYWRAFEQWRYARSQGVPEAEAKERGRQRLLVMADQDLSLAMREGARQVLTDSDVATGSRRIVRPEQSRGGPCGLCLAASDRTYRKTELLPLHSRCCCDVMPITRHHDPGQDLNTEDLFRLYDVAGSNSGQDLKQVRAVVRHHGELGPVLRAA